MAQKRSFTRNLVWTILVVITAVCILYGLSGDKEQPEQVSAEPVAAPTTAAFPDASPPTHTQQAETSRDTLGSSTGETVEAWVAAKQFVRDKLISPSTAKFNGIARSPYVVYLGDARYRVTASVDSQNGFGAMIRTEFEATVRARRDEHQTWVLEDLEL